MIIYYDFGGNESYPFQVDGIDVCHTIAKYELQRLFAEHKISVTDEERKLITEKFAKTLYQMYPDNEEETFYQFQELLESHYEDIAYQEYHESFEEPFDYSIHDIDL